MLLALVLWIGGLVFFAFVVAPTVFTVLPTRDLAGSVVNRSLGILHIMGLVCGIVFAGASMFYASVTGGAAQPFAPRHLLIYAMLVLTLVAQFVVAPKMATLRADMGVIDRIPHDDARRVEFNRLHGWSTRLGGAILVLGLGVLFLTARRLH